MTTPNPAPAVLNWPGDPETVTAESVDFEALAHVLGNTCRRGGRCRRYHSLAAHAVIVSEEIEALEGLAGEERRALALHGLLAGAASAWFRGGRTAKLATRIETALREAAGLDAAPDEEQAELLRFVERMADAAESRDLLEGDAPAGVAFPPLKRRIRGMAPERAAQAWLDRFRALAGGWAENGEAVRSAAAETGKPDAAEA